LRHCIPKLLLLLGGERGIQQPLKEAGGPLHHVERERRLSSNGIVNTAVERRHGLLRVCPGRQQDKAAQNCRTES
jgi:hypothetical protein